MVSKLLNGEEGAAFGGVVFGFGIRLGDNEQGKTSRAIGPPCTGQDQVNFVMGYPHPGVVRFPSLEDNNVRSWGYSHRIATVGLTFSARLDRMWFGPELQSFEEIHGYRAEPLRKPSVSKSCQLHLWDVELAANMGKRLHGSLRSPSRHWSLNRPWGLARMTLTGVARQH